MPKLGKLPRDLIQRFASDPRSLRFIENLQSQAFDVLPTTLQQLISAIQHAQLSADAAQTTAVDALNKKPPDQLGMVGVPVFADQMLGVVGVGSDHLPDLQVIPICCEVTP